ncbi:hypothetical protein HMN09_00334000 [Mycena chlorophos]|uniref:Ribosomal protein S8 n=1 Tax=Mycena chlorophos TaxID=658473 RepID=A0A8H6TIM0_MYCCL|nr:hypothetical protein HMN09_00334000 [Mycena chlorophos]
MLAHNLLHHSTQNLGILSILYRAGFVSNISRGTSVAADPALFDVETNDAEKRIWAILKYRNDLPVLQNMSAISKPSKRVFMTLTEIRLLCTGRRAQNVPPLGLGEVIVIHTNSKEHEWVEAREAVKLRLGGEVMCRAQ